MSMYEQFKTAGGLEQDGVYFEFGDFRVKLARAGGSNKRYQKALEAKTKPYRRAMQTGLMPNEQALEILRETYVDSVILDWHVRVDGDQWQAGIHAPDGSVLPYTKENVLKALTDLPELFAEIQEHASTVANYREATLESDAGN